MKKKVDLASSLTKQKEQEETMLLDPEPSKSPAKTNRKPGGKSQSQKENTVNIAGWFPMGVRLELEEIRLLRSRALGRKVTMQELQAEAYNDLFKKYNRPELAPTGAR